MKHTAINIFLKFTLPLVVTLCVILTGLPSFLPPQRTNIENRNDFRDHFNDRIPKYMRYYNIPGLSLAWVEKGQIIWTQAYGYADIQNGRLMTCDTPCRVESISKSLTAWGVMKLVQDGRVDLDAPLTDYLKSWHLPDSPFDENAITIRMLLTQTSGMPLGTIGIRYDPAGPRPTLRDQLTQDALLFQAPGTSFSYSNTGYNLLELLIEELSGRHFSDYMKEEVLLPLGMKHSSFEWSRKLFPPVPNGYDNDGNAIAPYVYPDKAAGGLFAPADDIARFLIAGMDQRGGRPVLSSTSLGEIYTPHTDIPGYYGIVFDAYGYGHFIEYLNDTLTTVSHGGQGSGWMTHFHSVPEKGDAIIMLSNSQNSWPFFAYMLKDWSQWRGYSAPGMTMITHGTKIMWSLIGLLIYVSLLMVWTLTSDLFSRRRYLAPFATQDRIGRAFLFFLSLMIAGILLWIASLPYFFLMSIFPIAAEWLGKSLAAIALLLLCQAVFPRKQILRNNIKNEQIYT